MSNSASAQPLLCSLAVFRNILNQGSFYINFQFHSFYSMNLSISLCAELIRSVHGYRDGGGEMRWVEREFVFSPTSCTEIVADPMILLRVDDHKFLEGGKIGLWLCILAFDSVEKYLSSSSSSIPSILCFSRYLSFYLVRNLMDLIVPKICSCITVCLLNLNCFVLKTSAELSSIGFSLKFYVLFFAQ